MQLTNGTILQGGKYKILSFLGKGGFGITYEAEQALLNRKVAIKEFFMRDYCERVDNDIHVSVPSAGSRDLVERFRQKFIKEAGMIASLNHPNIVKIYDIFDRGYITFSDDRRATISNWLSRQVKERIGIKENQFFQFLPINESCAKYLDYHRSTVFKG